jgi:HTH-type transcriptional regulator/antitoxin HigA
MNTPTRAEVFPAGEFLADELEARGWTQAEFAEVVGRPPQFVSEIISGKKEITRESAAQIAAALGTSTELWLNLQDAYFLWRQSRDSKTQTTLDEVRTRARMKELAPVSILVKRGFIKSAGLHQQAEELRKLYRMVSLEDEPNLQIAARRTNQDEALSSTQLAWVACVQFLAEGREIGTFSLDRMMELGARISHEVEDPAAFSALPALFADYGVNLVYVESFPSSKLDGCSLMMDGNPVIGISGRGKRLDKVLFTLLHEVAHLALGHLDGDGLIVDDPDAPHTLGTEKDADDLASSWVLPNELPVIPERVSSGWINRAAAAQGVHPIVVVGRLQKLEVLNWRTALVKDAPNVDSQLSSWVQ